MADRRGGAPILLAVALPLVVLSIDFAGIAVALPEIGRELGVSPASAGWVVNAFAIGAAGPLLVTGRLADRTGRRRVLLAGVVLFSMATLVCAAAPGFAVLVSGRVVQGVATSLFMPASLSVVSTAFSDRRAWAIGVWSAIGSTAAAAAPVVGGLVVESLGWRWFFVVNLPLLAVALALTVRSVPESHGDRAPIDWTGAALATAGVSAVMVGLQAAATRGWGDPSVLLAMFVGLGVLVLFVMQQRGASSPLIAKALRHALGYRPPLAVAFLANWGFGALNILGTFWLQDVRGLSPSTTGLIFLAYSVPFALVGASTGRVVDRFGHRLPMVVGMALVAVSFVAVARVGSESQPWPILVAMVLSGVGQGLAYNVSTTAAMSAVPDEDAGIASGVLTALRNVGVAAGVAIASTATAAGPGETGIAASAMSVASWVVVAASVAGMAVAGRSSEPQTVGLSSPPA